MMAVVKALLSCLLVSTAWLGVSCEDPFVPGLVTNTVVKQNPLGCRKVSSCACETASGQKVDLTPLGNTNSTPRFRDVTLNGQYMYSWNPCYGFNEGGCQGVGVCQTVPDATPGNYNLGNQSSVDFEISSSLGLVIRYTGEGGPMIPPRMTYIRLECDTSVEADFTVQGEQVLGTYYFTLRSRYACLSGGPPANVTIPTPPTPPTPGSNTVPRPTPTSNPIYSLKTVVDLLFALTVVAVGGLVVLLLVLTVICVRRGMTAGPSGNAKEAIADSHLYFQQSTNSDKKQLLHV